ncbi:hypothetical protein AD951_10310 [Acetobacter malorum]|uniref:Uncharacterized protein n=1 Tax=Acetobacter malorum TaxID=178901 RepID=A0A149UKX1_9PROT|nr:hypothetical protein AD951_10310 [Acetobacter malorum]
MRHPQSVQKLQGSKKEDANTGTHFQDGISAQLEGIFAGWHATHGRSFCPLCGKEDRGDQHDSAPCTACLPKTKTGYQTAVPQRNKRAHTCALL